MLGKILCFFGIHRKMVSYQGTTVYCGRCFKVLGYYVDCCGKIYYQKK